MIDFQPNGFLLGLLFMFIRRVLFGSAAATTRTERLEIRQARAIARYRGIGRAEWPFGSGFSCLENLCRVGRTPRKLPDGFVRLTNGIKGCAQLARKLTIDHNQQFPPDKDTPRAMQRIRRQGYQTASYICRDILF